MLPNDSAKLISSNSGIYNHSVRRYQKPSNFISALYEKGSSDDVIFCTESSTIKFELDKKDVINFPNITNCHLLIAISIKENKAVASHVPPLEIEQCYDEFYNQIQSYFTDDGYRILLIDKADYSDVSRAYFRAMNMCRYSPDKFTLVKADAMHFDNAKGYGADMYFRISDSVLFIRQHNNISQVDLHDERLKHLTDPKELEVCELLERSLQKDNISLTKFYAIDRDNFCITLSFQPDQFSFINKYSFLNDQKPRLNGASYIVPKSELISFISDVSNVSDKSININVGDYDKNKYTFQSYNYFCETSAEEKSNLEKSAEYQPITIRRGIL